MLFFKKTIKESFVQVYLVVGGFTSTTELLTEGDSAWAFAGLVPIQAWKTVISINNEIITTGDCFDVLAYQCRNFNNYLLFLEKSDVNKKISYLFQGDIIMVDLYYSQQLPGSIPL